VFILRYTIIKINLPEGNFTLPYNTENNLVVIEKLTTHIEKLQMDNEIHILRDDLNKEKYESADMIRADRLTSICSYLNLTTPYKHKQNHFHYYPL
jgi:DNA-binding Xre family transcriptional regulator